MCDIEQPSSTPMTSIAHTNYSAAVQCIAVCAIQCDSSKTIYVALLNPTQSYALRSRNNDMLFSAVCCHWLQVGIRLDEPSGLNNGTAKGVRIFECEEGFGSFVRGKNVTVGDYPERDLMDSDDETEGENNERDEDEI